MIVFLAVITCNYNNNQLTLKNETNKVEWNVPITTPRRDLVTLLKLTSVFKELC